MEVAPRDTDTDVEWGGFGTSIGTSTALGTGKANTKAIVNKLGTGNYAAKITYDLVEGGYDDWFLPSKDELNELYKQKNTVGGLTSYFYWSSSGSGSFDAWRQDFYSGGQNDVGRNYSRHVRAVRAF